MTNERPPSYFRRMWRAWLALALFFLQVLTFFRGVAWVGKEWAAVLPLFATMALGWHYLSSRRLPSAAVDTPARRELPARHRRPHAWVGLTSVLLVGAWCGAGLGEQFAAVPNYIDISDVIPQNVALFERTFTGEYPYYTVPMPHWSGPFPVYMPLHWLPVGVGHFFHLDVRWSGAIILLGAFAWIGYVLGARADKWYGAAAIGPAAGLIVWGYILYTDHDIAVSFDLHIAAYYAILSLGLVLRSPRWIAAGLVLCALSRYTLAFWMPTFVLVLLWEPTHRTEVLRYLGILVVAVVVLYVLPFVTQDPAVLFKGVKYHNDAAIAEWRGFDGVSYTMEVGVYFANIYKQYLPGDVEIQLYKARVVQGVMMLAIMFASLYGYYRLRGRVNVYDYLLFVLYMVIAHFYLFGALTYRYYYLGLFGISAVMVGQMLVAPHRATTATTATTVT